MLSISDLHNEQELSAFEMGKVAGGADKTKDEETIRNASTALDQDVSAGPPVTMATLWNEMFGSFAPF